MQPNLRPLSFWKSVLLVIFTCAICGRTEAEQTNKIFRAGAAAIDISPWMGISINGGMHDHKGTNLHDPLHARAIVLDDGTTRLAIVVADSCMIYREIF